MVYLDNGATTAPYPEVVETMKEVLQTYYGNPSSLHHLGVQSEKVLKQSRELTAKFLEVSPGEIVFTSGATESNNTAIKGIAFQYQNRGKHIITSAVEHPAVLDVCKQLQDIFGVRLTVLPVDSKGMVRLDDLKQAITDETILVSIMFVNNEVGSIQPIQEIGNYLKSFPKIFFHVDAVQAFGKIPVKPETLGIDLLSLSAHKFHGPKGTGILYVRKGTQLTPLLVGGGQEAKFRPGTENLAGIVGMVKAMRLTQQKLKDQPDALKRMRNRLVEGLQGLEGCYINSPEEGAPHILNLSVPGVKSEVLLHSLEDKGIYVSTKSACSSKLDRPSRVLMEMGLGEERARSALRISLSYENTIDEMDYFITTMKQVVPQLKQMLNVR
ncbi:cysteine desulfurase family protein [Ammoniphilus resinae]|uniref:Cysteine desulfurase n=1 Tax=Ammoniphilus resinae TaxID=861532 RepID=A0ABS4GRK1_9BACL|nr:cysteine desulfurase [Ammoniphilus resinae]